MAVSKDDWRFRYKCEYLTGTKKCGNSVGDKTAYWCKDHPEKTGGKILCFEHQSDYLKKVVSSYAKQVSS